MALLTVEEARAAGQFESVRLRKSASAALNEAITASAGSSATFDIFLSHSRLDSDIVLGVKRILEKLGKSVYVDWINDPQLDRSSVTSQTAEQLRTRMRQCRALFYAHSGNASKSRWMPWELGFYDGYKGNVAVLPLVDKSSQTSYQGEEYLGIYPYVDITGGTVYVHKNSGTYRGFDGWTTQADKLRPAA